MNVVLDLSYRDGTIEITPVDIANRHALNVIKKTGPLDIASL